MCAPPDYVERLAEVDVPLILVGESVLAGARGLGGPPDPGRAAAG